MAWEHHSFGKSSLLCAVFRPYWLYKNGPSAWKTSSPRDEGSSQPLLGLSPCVEIHFPVSDSMCASFFKNGHHRAPGLSHYYYVCPLWGGNGSVAALEGYMQINCPVWLQQGPAGHGDWHTLLKLILVSSLREQNVFHLLLMFSLATLLLNSNGQKCSDFYSW